MKRFHANFIREEAEGALVLYAEHQKVVTDLISLVLEVRQRVQEAGAAADELRDMVAAGAAELAALRAENAHLKRALALSDALRNKERNLPL